MSRTTVALAILIGMATTIPVQAGTVPPPMSEGTARPAPASDRPLIYRPTTTDPIWEQIRRDGP